MLTLVQTSNKCQQHSWLIYFNLNLTKSLKYLSLAELPSLLIYSIPPEKSWLPRIREGLNKPIRDGDSTALYAAFTFDTVDSYMYAYTYCQERLERYWNGQLSC